MKAVAFTGLLLLLLLSGCTVTGDKPTKFVSTADLVRLEIRPNTTRAQLDSIQQILKNHHNIIIDHSRSVFGASGKVELLELVVDCQDGYAGSVCCSKSALKSSAHGFERNYRNAGAPFRTGSLR